MHSFIYVTNLFPNFSSPKNCELSCTICATSWFDFVSMGPTRFASLQTCSNSLMETKLKVTGYFPHFFSNFYYVISGRIMKCGTTWFRNAVPINWPMASSSLCSSRIRAFFGRLGEKLVFFSFFELKNLSYFSALREDRSGKESRSALSESDCHKRHLVEGCEDSVSGEEV